MARTFYLRLLLAGQDDLVCEVPKAESDRLRDRLSSEDAHGRFFWFDTIDGRSIIVNLEHLQGVRYLWEAAGRSSDSSDIEDDLAMTIALSGRELISEPPSEDAKDVYTLLWELELDGAKTVTFTDVDGEAFTLVTSQIAYISAPKEVVDEGRRQVGIEDGLEEP